MAFGQEEIERIAAWCLLSTELADEREKAWGVFFGEDDPRPVKYWPGADDEVSRKRRFVAWLMFDCVLPGGGKPGEIAAKRLFAGRQRSDALEALAGARFLLAQFARKIARGVILKLEDETFEVRSEVWAANLRAHQAIAAHIVPVREGYWLPGPGWLVWPVTLGPGIRTHLKDLQLDPIATERLLQGRLPAGEAAPRKRPPTDSSLPKAVSRMTAWARKRGYKGMEMSPEEFQALVLRFMTGPGKRPRFNQYIQTLVKKAGVLESEEELQEMLDLATNIWNNTPQPDRGGKSANQMVRST